MTAKLGDAGAIDRSEVERELEMPTFERRKHARGHTYTLNGEKVPGPTTILDKVIAKQGLVPWAAEAAALHAVLNWDELGELGTQERVRRIKKAPSDDRDAAARRGTEVHRLAHRLAAGEEVDLPDELEGHVDAYLRFVDDWQPRELLVEAPIANVRWRYCGTIDFVGDLADGNRWLLDLKTTRSGVFRETALQLAAYRYATHYLDSNGKAQPMLDVDRCGVVWLKADRTYELVPVEAGEAVHRVYLYAMQIATFLDSDAIGEPLPAPAKATA